MPGRGGGRPAKPTAQKLEQGTLREHRERGKAPEPPALEVVPPAPPELGEVARQTWVRYAAILVARRYLTDGDLMLLEMLAREWERYVILLDEVNVEGVVAPTVNGGLGRNPKCLELNAAFKNAFAVLAELGLGPRARVAVRGAGVAPKESDPFGEFRVLPGGKK